MCLRSDLSFYNWDTQHSTSNESPNFQILPDHEQGLLFKNKRDRKAAALLLIQTMCTTRTTSEN